MTVDAPLIFHGDDPTPDLTAECSRPEAGEQQSRAASADGLAAPGKKKARTSHRRADGKEGVARLLQQGRSVLRVDISLMQAVRAARSSSQLCSKSRNVLASAAFSALSDADVLKGMLGDHSGGKSYCAENHITSARLANREERKANSLPFCYTCLSYDRPAAFPHVSLGLARRRSFLPVPRRRSLRWCTSRCAHSRKDSFSGFGDKIGVVDLEGVILDPKDVVEQLRKFADDSSIKAIIIHVNSPGGGAAASEEIYREVLRIRDKNKKADRRFHRDRGRQRRLLRFVGNQQDLCR